MRCVKCLIDIIIAAEERKQIPMDDRGNSCTQAISAVLVISRNTKRVRTCIDYTYISTEHFNVILKRASAKREPFVLLAIQGGESLFRSKKQEGWHILDFLFWETVRSTLTSV